MTDYHVLLVLDYFVRCKILMINWIIFILWNIICNFCTFKKKNHQVLVRPKCRSRVFIKELKRSIYWRHFATVFSMECSLNNNFHIYDVRKIFHTFLWNMACDILQVLVFEQSWTCAQEVSFMSASFYPSNWIIIYSNLIYCRNAGATLVKRSGYEMFWDVLK